VIGRGAVLGLNKTMSAVKLSFSPSEEENKLWLAELGGFRPESPMHLEVRKSMRLVFG
jgi:hypothetical protein